ncbi:HAD-IC family P-type ATPase [Lactiplantibacillus plantarum]|uniref:HAD-IC family P-type ATPase n=1 Tax=Lactiplantibacillus plantarum TaxID=1590 RepID=UPI002237F46A|nr:HAD-IC family P-type ATPase [Lactiplantibacillus plantarum]MCW6100689.1 HAD-IC family P-type ATPase [Lactiplantibacillus plantarum]MCW6103675.1 HAD-IC family P-type ATPase [Lactiplantibacillus plantarum]
MIEDLTEQQAAAKLAADGFNDVPEPTFNFFKAVVSRLWEPSAWILEGALVIEVVLGKEIQAGFIALMLVFAAVNGAIQSRRAALVLQELAHQLTPTSSVRRAGHWQLIDAKALVVGDLISLQVGSVIPADIRVLTNPIHTDESSITGESVAVSHTQGETAFAGTMVVAGETLARVLATGSHSRAGKTVSLINQNNAPGHLQRLLGKIIGYLALLDSALALIIVGIALIRHADMIQMLPFLAMLFIATIPIAMPSSFAVANSVEARELSQQRILVSELTGIQEAANLNLLLVDKTGTITTNQPQVVQFKNLSARSDQQLLRLAASATDSRHPSVVDQAIVNFAHRYQLKRLPQQEFKPFDASVGYAEALVGEAPTVVRVRIGALSRLYELTAQQPALAIDQLDLTRGRSVAVMINNVLQGVLILQDQPRPDSAAALKRIQHRGVKTIMLTGDNLKTAQAVADAVGLKGQVVSYQTFKTHSRPLAQVAGIAEVVPENKLAIVKAMQRAGYVVGMTGDGVNDAPALKQSEVGIAVDNATDLAKRSAKFVLLTGGLANILTILDSGHRVYQRMLTWTITKLTRTVELTVLLTIGYLWLDYVPLSLNAMVLVAILNDLVTLVLGTDRTIIRHRPEQWDMPRLSKIAGFLATGWTAVGVGLIVWLHGLGLSAGQLSTSLYVYLIFSAMLTILMTRTSGPFWRGRPSRAVGLTIGLNCLLTIGLASSGWGVPAISGWLTLIVIVLVLMTGIGLTVAGDLWRRLTK